MKEVLYLALLLPIAALAQEDESPQESVTASGEQVAASQAQSAGPENEESEVKQMLGMSILGNEEAPKALVIVPWKSSQIGDGLGVSNSLDDQPGPVDREVFMREVRYFELRSGSSE